MKLFLTLSIVCIILLLSTIRVVTPNENINLSNIDSNTINNYKDKCEKNDFLYCEELGSIYYFSEKNPTNQNYAKKYLEKSCNNKIATSCLLLGVIYQDENLYKSKKYLEKSCLYGNGYACYTLADKSDIQSVFRDEKYMKKMFKEACSNGFYFGCYKYLLSVLNI